jgi:hypothetical protein
MLKPKYQLYAMNALSMHVCSSPLHTMISMVYNNLYDEEEQLFMLNVYGSTHLKTQNTDENNNLGCHSRIILRKYLRTKLYQPCLNYKTSA